MLDNYTLSTYNLSFEDTSEKTKSGLNAPDGENKAITIKYTSTVNKDWLEYTKNYPDTKTHTNNATFHVGNGSKTGSHPVDIVPSTPFQIYKKLYAGRVIKEKDAAGAEHDVNLQSIAEDGTVYFPFQIAITGVDGTKDLVIDDTFDTDALEFYSTNVTINGNSYSYDGSIYQGSAWGIWQSNLINDVKPSIENLSNGIRFTITKEQAKKLADTYGTSVHYYICYCLKLKNAQAFDAAHEDKEAKFTNTARTEDGTSSAQVDFNYRSEPITKEETAEPRPVNGVWLVDYKIVVNPLGQDLVKGEDNLEVTDTPSDNLVILPDTIQYNGTSTQNFRTDGSKYIFTIPDSQKCVITYQARLKVTESKNYTYNNTASVIGKSSTIPDKTKYITFDGSGSGTASMCSVKLHKFYKDGDQSHSLEGARFALYTDEACTKYAIDGQGNRLLSEKDTNGNEIGVETGTDGYLTIANLTPNSADGKTTHDYYLKEISAPNGYSILSGSIHFQISSDLVITFIGDVPSGVTKNGGYGLYLDVQDGVATETISGTKTWDDSNNQDGKRPESITVRLLADGKEVDSKTVTEKDEWKYSFTDLPKYAGGKEITYTVTEDAVDGYTAAVDGYNIKNTHKTETTTVSGTKTWDDSNNQDGKRPGSITVRLLADGKEVDSKTVTEKDEWKYSFTNLPKYAAGKEIAYTVTEDKVADYTTTINGFDITNTHKTETTSVSGMKTWDDSNNQDGKRPTSITVRLLADGKEVKSTEATEATGWKYSFTDLPKYAAGKEIVYTVAEDEVAGYATTINGYDITNTYTTEKTFVSGTKTWSDSNNQDGKRPESITVHLYANGIEAGTKSVTAADGWKYTFDNLPKYADGKVIKYTVTEDKVAGYTTTINGFNITNTYNTETTSVSGTKTWSDSNNQDGKRPTSITVRLLANGEEVDSKTVTAKDGWKYSFTDLPKYAAGKELTYTVAEDEVAGYAATINGYDITNTYTTETTSVSGTKTWSDSDNQDGVRPTSITVHLYANGVEAGTKSVTAADGWKYTFDNLPKYADGKVIKYTVTEDEVAGYTTTINGYNITNTHKTETTSVAGTKTWSDSDNQDGVRPTSITVRLFADGKEVKSTEATEATGWKYSFTNLPKYAAGKEIAYTVTEDKVADYTTTINGFDIKNTHKTETTSVSGTKTWSDNGNQDGKRPTSITVRLLADGKEVKSTEVTEATGWKYSFTDLPKYAAGKEIVYTVTEDEVAGYATTINGCDITNTYTTETTSVSGTKTWSDSDNQDGVRPTSITVHLYANGVEAGTKSVTAADGWKYTFDNLPKYADGKVIKYTVTEDEVAGYTTTINGFDITNTHKTETTSVSGTKTWSDSDNQDGVRPTSITVRLLANGEEVDSKTVTAKDDWKYSFTDLPKYAAGKEIAYTVTEDKVADYTTTINGFDITNTHKTETTSVAGTKTWSDNGNQDGKRPTSITVRLLADGKEVKSTEVTEATGWKYSFTDLPKYAAGKEITYTVAEDEVAGYATTINGYDITNTYTTETTSISGTKTWSDSDNQDGVRPTSITVHLYANGVEAGTKSVTAADGWKYTFDNLPKYADGKVIKYTVTEDEVAGYTTTIKGYNITNTHKTETTSVSGTKTWSDSDNQDGVRPTSIKIHLLADGKEVKSTEVTEASGWKYSFEDLPKYDAGKEIAYTVTEDAVPGYETTINGFDITNTHKTETTSVAGTKTWSDNGNQDGKRPTSITVRLLADGKEVKSTEATEATGWKYSFTDLPKYAAGKEIVYTVAEDEVAGYATTINGYDITNTYTTETTSVSGTKTWSDNDNQDGVRPSSITVHLYANGVEAGTKSVTAADDWKYTFDNLPKFADGKEIKYTVTEDEVAGYTTTINGFDIVNTHKTGLTQVSVRKVWDDNNNEANIRPSSITVQLYADGKAYGNAVTLNEDNKWSYTWSDLAVNAAGKAITYTVDETQVPDGYTKSVTNNETAFTITNTHTITRQKAGSITLTATKNLVGATLQAGDFSFEVLEGSSVVATGTNDASGVIRFTTINYTAVGEHDYTVREAAGSMAGVTYDTTVYNVHVSVTDDGTDTLKVTATGADGMVFTNTYNEDHPHGDTPHDNGGGNTPHHDTTNDFFDEEGDNQNDMPFEDEDSDNQSETIEDDSSNDTPRTGDDSHLLIWFVLIALAATGITGSSIYRKKRRDHENEQQ